MFKSIILNTPKLALLLFLALTSIGKTSYIWVPPEEYAQKVCPIIVRGKIVKVDSIKSDDQSRNGFDYAYIKVDKIYKNILNDIFVSRKRLIKVKMAPIRISNRSDNDIRYEIGTKGIWLISLQDKYGLRINSNPVQYQKIKDKKKLKNAGVFKVEFVKSEKGKKVVKMYSTSEWIRKIYNDRINASKKHRAE